MNYFTDLIAKIYLAYVSDEEIDIALFYFNEFLKVKPGTGGEAHFSKNHFFKKLVSILDLLIDGSYSRYADSVFDPSVMDYDTFEYELNQRREIIEDEAQNDFYAEEYSNIEPVTVIWEECHDAKTLTYALKYKGISLKDSINIIITNDDTQIVLRKSKLEFLKLEAKRANISTISNGPDYLFDDSSYLKEIEKTSNQDKSDLNLKSSNVIDVVNSESTQGLNDKLDIISRDIESIKTSKPQSDFLNAKGAADFLDLSIHTVRMKTSKNEIPHMKKGKKLIFSRVELTEYLKSGKVKTIAEIEEEADNFIPKSRRK